MAGCLPRSACGRHGDRAWRRCRKSLSRFRSPAVAGHRFLGSWLFVLILDAFLQQEVEHQARVGNAVVHAWTMPIYCSLLELKSRTDTEYQNTGEESLSESMGCENSLTQIGARLIQIGASPYPVRRPTYPFRRAVLTRFGVDAYPDRRGQPEMSTARRKSRLRRELREVVCPGSPKLRPHP